MFVKKEQYKPFDKFVLRTPLFPLSIIENRLTQYKNDKCFNEAVFIASPELYFEKQKQNSKESDKLLIALNKYLYRSFFRCTPFGLFAGCSIGKWGDECKVHLTPRREHYKQTRLDMNYLFTLINVIENEPYIRSRLKYYVNDSVYQIANQIRYVEYIYMRNLSVPII